MENHSNYKRPGFICRPWITGKLYDQYASKLILHMDAYVVLFAGHGYLTIEWREGGALLVALDTYLIESDGLVPVWDITRAHGKALYWGETNNALMARLHKTVLDQPARMLELGRGRWTRVSAQCHYVHVREKDAEIPPERNYYVTPKNAPAFPTVRTLGKKRGRPRKVETTEVLTVARNPYETRSASDLLADTSVETLPDILNEPEVDPGDLRYVSQKADVQPQPQRRRGRPRTKLPNWL